VTQTITADALTSTQTITPSPVTITSQATIYTTTVATATTIVVDTHIFEFHLVEGPANGRFYNAGLQSGFIKEADEVNCADNCARKYFSDLVLPTLYHSTLAKEITLDTPNCVAYTIALYVPGGWNYMSPL
jgi:hypothetical protein